MNFLSAKKTAKRFALPAFFLLLAIFTALAARPFSVAVDLHAAHRTAPNLPVPVRNQQLAFELNEGQCAREVQFVSRAPNYTVLLEPSQARIFFRGKVQHSGTNQASLAKNVTTRPFACLRLLQSNRASAPLAEEPLFAKTNYFIGSDPGKWRTNVPLFARVRYPSVYKNVDLVYYGSQKQLEYDFVIRPGGRPQSIRFSIAGAARAKIEQSGDLALQTGDAHMVLHRPFAYQIINGQRCRVSAGFLPLGGQQFGILVGDYDRKLSLIVDPVLAYSTYLGGLNDEGIFGIGFDDEDNIYIAGETSSLDFPVEGAVQNQVGGSYDAFVSKFDAKGARLIYSTYLGGSQLDHAVGIKVDESGSVYTAGITYSTDFPVTNAWQPSLGAMADGFVAKLSPSGSELVFSTYLGGNGFDSVGALALDHDDHVYVTGRTNSLDFPTTSNAFQKECDGGAHPTFCFGDAFVAQFDSSGQNLVYSTYLGGSGYDTAGGLAVDERGQTYIVGLAFSYDFPTRNPYQSSPSGIGDAFVTKLDAAGSDIVFSTFLGGGSLDAAFDVALDHRNDVYVTGYTTSTDFPLVRAFQSKNQGGFDGFVTKLDSEGSKLIYSTYVGGSRSDFPIRIAVHAGGEASVTGFTSSTDFPTYNALYSSYSGGRTEAFVVTLDRSGQEPHFSTYLGGSGDEYGYAITIGPGNSVWVGGSTSSGDFPLVQAFQNAYAGGPFDAFLCRIVKQDEQ